MKGVQEEKSTSTYLADSGTGSIDSCEEEIKESMLQTALPKHLSSHDLVLIKRAGHCANLSYPLNKAPEKQTCAERGGESMMRRF